MPRIKVKYIAGPNYKNFMHEFRWIEGSNLYDTPTGTFIASSGYTEQPTPPSGLRRWVRAGGTICEEVLELPSIKAGTVPSSPAKPSGGSNSYYKVEIKKPTTEGTAPYVAECNDIIEALGMNYAEGNAFKALWRSCAEKHLGLLKPGQEPGGVYDAEKVVFFGQRILEQRK